MVNITDIAPLESLVAPFQNLINTVEVILGGIFGLYLIFIIYKVYSISHERKILKDIRNDIRHIGSLLEKSAKKKRKGK